jgi:hypothetical protein
VGSRLDLVTCHPGLFSFCTSCIHMDVHVVAHASVGYVGAEWTHGLSSRALYHAHGPQMDPSYTYTYNQYIVYICSCEHVEGNEPQWEV